MKHEFARLLYDRMKKDKNTWLLVGDVGWGIFDRHRKDFPDRALNVGAAEHSMLCIAVGLTLEGKTVFVYSITPFLLWRGAEVIRNYINEEQIPCKLIGGGRDDDYKELGFSHTSEDCKRLLHIFHHVIEFYPQSKTDIKQMFNEMVKNKSPYFLSLKR